MSHLTISRQAEYFSVKELQLMTGRPERDFANVIVKELLDNALDAAETIGIKPIIALDIDEIDNRLIITVADNGGGIPADLINKIVDFNTRTSDKVARRLPSRGSQGNGIKTILGIPVALGGGHVAIESHNLKHLIKPSILPGGDVDIQVITQDTDWALGTRITVNMPVINVSSHWQLKFELFNPHITFVKNCELQNGQLPCSIEHQKNCDFYKIWPDEPTSVHWYTFEAFYTLLHLTGRQTDKPLGEYIRLFKGLTATGKAKAIASRFNERNVSELDEEAALELYRSMLSESKQVQPKALGPIGEKHWKIQEYKRFWYKRGELLLGGVPYLFECAVLDNDSDTYFFGINHSPSYRDFLTGITVNFKNRSFQGAVEAKQQILSPLTLIVHLVCPSLNFTDRGKTSVVLPDEVNQMIGDCLARVLSTLYCESEKARRDAAKAERNLEQIYRQIDNSLKVTLKDAVFSVLPKAIDAATSARQYPANVRNLYYKVRAAIQKLTDKELDYNYFSQNLLISYWEQEGRDALIFNDPRGILYEPHSGRYIQLGTYQVRNYVLPEWEYDKILFIEKKGLWPTIEASGLPKRYDLAVIASEGYACEAARLLMAMAAKKCTLFVIHDADPDGYNIARTLAEETRRMPGHSINVIDLGLNIAQAVDMGLESETFSRKKELSEALNFTIQEKTYFEGTKTGKKCWIARRVELNAMSAGELIELIEAGINRHVEHKKLIPPTTVLINEWDQQIYNLVGKNLTQAIYRRLSLNAVIGRIAETFKPGDVRGVILKHFNNHPEQSWREAIEADVNEVIDSEVIDKEAENILKDLAA